MANYLRNLHAQFFDDDGVKKIKVFFETHMDTTWNLINIQVPAANDIITDNLILVFKIHESSSSKITFNTIPHSFVYDVEIPVGFKHFTSVILYHSQGSDHDSVGTAGDPT